MYSCLIGFAVSFIGFVTLWYLIKSIILRRSVAWLNVIRGGLILGTLTMIFCLIIQEFFLDFFGLEEVENIILEDLFIIALLLITIEPTLTDVVHAITKKERYPNEMEIFLTYALFVLVSVGAVAFYLLYFEEEKYLGAVRDVVNGITRFLSFIMICLTITMFFMNHQRRKKKL